MSLSKFIRAINRIPDFIEHVKTWGTIDFTGTVSGKNWAECHDPYRKDKNPSAGVYLGSGPGRGYLKRFVNGSREHKIPFFDLAKELNPNLRGKWNDKEVAKYYYELVGMNSNGKIVKAYDYVNLNGRLIYQVCRMDPKSFRQRKPDPEKTDSWIWNMKGVDPLPYHLPELIKHENRTIYICGGEKDVDRLMSLGLTASCNSGGEGNWPSQINKYYKNKDIIIVPDIDSAGEKFGQHVAHELYPIAQSVKIVDLPKNGLPKNGDLSDWFDAGNTIDDLQVLVKKTRPLEKAPLSLNDIPPKSDLPSENEKRKKLEFITLDQIYLEKLQEKPIARGFVEEGEQILLYAPGGVGKSILSLDLALHLAYPYESHSKLWGQFQIPKHRHTIFIQSENSQLATHLRIRKKCAVDLDFKAGLDNVYFPKIHNDVRISGFFDDDWFTFQIVELIKKIEEEKEIKMDCMVIDPLISFHSADENDNSRMRSTLDCIVKVAGACQVTPIVIHHSNKNQEIRGASSIFDWARSIVKIERVKGRTKNRVKLIHEKSNNFPIFKDFIMEMDSNLNFSVVNNEDMLSSKKKKICSRVRDALELCGGRARKKQDLIDKYKTISGIGANTTAHDHINDAVKFDFIKVKYIEDKNGITQPRYDL